MGSETSTNEKITGLRDALRALPREPGERRLRTKRDYVRTLADELNRARRMGYTLKELAEVLAAQGLEINHQMLGQYLRSAPTSPALANLAKGKAEVATQSTTKSASDVVTKAPANRKPERDERPSAVTPETSAKAVPARVNHAVPPASQPRQSGNIDKTVRPQSRGPATSSGGFNARPDTDEI